ncbi:hypothetical protein PHET_00014 [Paragonimus heterotremus]|uniref:Cysteine-rich DPF motif domain-containing protein 1 n=1 Tax=Paragonimus heterotremus TaxID=100268 RepID=A0A8J4T5H2_9TREM|nr:hypothetical protein PHET_00014 [Paragonimus heterotremus]
MTIKAESRNISIATWNAYTMRDPFADDNLGGIILGSDCCICKEMVCISQNCSLFYNKRYCRDCSVKHADEFPPDLRQASFVAFHLTGSLGS